jgi:hypothetical protein
MQHSVLWMELSEHPLIGEVEGSKSDRFLAAGPGC